MTLTIALLATTLSVPHPVEPRELPLPRVERADARRLEREEATRADVAERRPLPYEVRAVGELVRRFGAAEREPSPRALELLGELREAAARAYERHGLEPLFALRALQARLFVRAVRRFEESGEVHPDLSELGGEFVNKARQTGWLTGAHHVTLQDRELLTLFRVRWSLLLGLQQNRRLHPTLDDWRSYHHIWITSLLQSDLPHSERLPRLADHVAALGRRDPSYPADLALGILALQQGQPAEARGALVRHLTGPLQHVWQLRAKNYLALALQRSAAPE